MKTNPVNSPTLNRILVAGLLVGLMALIAGCWQRSLHAFYLPSDVIPEPGLAGAWRQVSEKDGTPEKDGMTWEFTRIDDRRLDLVVIGDNGRDRIEYEVRAFRLGDVRFLDLFSKIRAVDVIPAHHLFRLIEVGAALRVTTLNPDWIGTWLKQHPDSMAHVILPGSDRPGDSDKDEYVLAADTPALQRFVREHLNDADFFTGEMVFRKRP